MFLYLWQPIAWAVGSSSFVFSPACPSMHAYIHAYRCAIRGLPLNSLVEYCCGAIKCLVITVAYLCGPVSYLHLLCTQVCEQSVVIVSVEL